MAYTFDEIFAKDASNPEVVAQAASITIFDPADPGKAPVAITDVTGSPLPNPITVNAQGFGPAFQHATLDRVGWFGGGFQNYLTSYEGMRAAAEQAKDAAEAAAAEAEAAAQAPTDAQVDEGIVRADIPATVAAVVAEDPTVVSSAATLAQSAAGLIPLWKATTVYTAGQRVVAPNGDVVAAKVNFTSGASYSAANWNASTQDGRIGAVETAATSNTSGVAAINQTAVFNGDKRLARTTSSPAYAHAWSDKNGRTPLGIRLDGTVDAPGGIDTPRAGRPLGASNSLAWAVTSPGGLVGEMALGLDGCVPAWVLSRWAARMGVIPSPTRITAYALTVSGSTSAPDTATSVQARIPFKLGADAVIEEISFRNYNDRSGLAYTGSLSFAGVYFGTHAQDAVGELTGNFTAAPSQIAGATVTPADGSEYKISGLSIPVAAGTEYLLSYGYTGAAQNNHSAVGGCWRNTTPANVSAATATQTISQTAPLDVWLKIRVAGNVPIIAYMGDSLSCGVSSQLPVYHSYPVKHAQMNGHIPVMYTHSGSAMTSWTSAGVVKYTKWAGLTKPDALVMSLGKNDLSTAVDTATMRTRFNTLYPVISAQVSKNIYLTTVLPDANDATTTGQLRRDWNAIIKTELLGNAVATFDMAAAVTTAAGGLDPLADSGDGVHLNKSGYARTAMSINQPLHR